MPGQLRTFVASHMYNHIILLERFRNGSRTRRGRSLNSTARADTASVITTYVRSTWHSISLPRMYPLYKVLPTGDRACGMQPSIPLVFLLSSSHSSHPTPTENIPSQNPQLFSKYSVDRTDKALPSTCSLSSPCRSDNVHAGRVLL